jgi:hypothetical protein
MCKGQIDSDINFKKESNKSNLIYEEINKTKSGNWKDVFTDIAQLALKNLAGEKKTFQFKTSLYAIKVKADSSKFIDYNYAKANFSRNFQINLGVDLDDDYKFKGMNYGVDWAIINKRDLSVNTLVDAEADILNEEYTEEFSNTKMKYFAYLKDTQDPDREKKINDFSTIMQEYEEGYVFPISKLPEKFREFLPANYSKRVSVLDAEIKKQIEKIKLEPLLTIGFNSNLKKKPKFFDEYNINMVYLQGLRSNNGSTMEIDFRNQFKVHDSVATDIIKRKEFSSQLGLNISILKKKDKSLIEFKPNFEFKRIFSGLMEDEKNNQFLANADLRVRVLKNLWIPLILKYDIKNNNLFGFLNVSFNFDAVKNE